MRHLSLPLTLLAWILVGGVLSFAGACGTEDRPAHPAPLASVSSSPDAGPEPWTPGNVCERLPKELCSRRHVCCLKSRYHFDNAVCESWVRQDCEANIQGVLGGTVGFLPANIPACLDALTPLLDACNSLPSEWKEILATTAPCRNLFEGDRTPGTSCSRASECEQPTQPEQITLCPQKKSVCVKEGVGALHAPCFSDGTLGFEQCEPGLYCKKSLADPGVASCEYALHIGDLCDLPGPNAPPCELGSFCTGPPLRCQPAKAFGKDCTAPAQCLSRNCVYGSCASTTLLLSEEDCGLPCVDSSCSF